MQLYTVENEYEADQKITLLTFCWWLLEPPRDKTNKTTVRPAKTQISMGIHSVWLESLLCAQWVAKAPSFLHADSEDSDQTGRMPRLILVFAGRTCHFVGFVMSWLFFNGYYLNLCQRCFCFSPMQSRMFEQSLETSLMRITENKMFLSPASCCMCRVTSWCHKI